MHFEISGFSVANTICPVCTLPLGDGPLLLDTIPIDCPICNQSVHYSCTWLDPYIFTWPMPVPVCTDCLEGDD